MPSLNGQAPGSLTIGDEHSVVSLIADGEDEGLGILAKSGTTTIKGAKINLTTSGTTSRVVQLAGPGVLMLGDSESVINITATGVDDGTGVAAFTNGSINIFGSELTQTFIQRD